MSRLISFPTLREEMDVQSPLIQPVKKKLPEEDFHEKQRLKYLEKAKELMQEQEQRRIKFEKEKQEYELQKKSEREELERNIDLMEIELETWINEL